MQEDSFMKVFWLCIAVYIEFCRAIMQTLPNPAMAFCLFFGLKNEKLYSYQSNDRHNFRNILSASGAVFLYIFMEKYFKSRLFYGIFLSVCLYNISNFRCMAGWNSN